MKPLLRCFAASLLVGCGDNQDPAGAKALWKSIHDQDYRSFPRALGYESKRKSNAPHGDQVMIYVNDVLAQTRRRRMDLSRSTKPAVCGRS